MTARPVAAMVNQAARVMAAAHELVPVDFWTKVRAVRIGGPGYELDTDRGEVTAAQVVFALGYEMPPRMLSGLVNLHSTFAIVTEPVEGLGRWGGAPDSVHMLHMQRSVFIGVYWRHR